MKALEEQLLTRNVASEITTHLCKSVTTSLVGQRLERFTTVASKVKGTLKESIERILTPKRSIDVLAQIKAKPAGQPFVIVFAGINGVGKSTSLAKVTYLLKSNGHTPLIAACDTFRAGAVEQLKQHASKLGVELFEKGYERDPAGVAVSAIRHAQATGKDVVLVDTAGRMQNNSSLMQALSNLVISAAPDLVLFVGEALVGNDGIDQLREFNKAIIDYTPRGATPRPIDGIILTKFDTIDDKVGASLSMVYQTGQPIVFVGNGQHYTNLKALNVSFVVRALLS